MQFEVHSQMKYIFPLTHTHTNTTKHQNKYTKEQLSLEK